MEAGRGWSWLAAASMIDLAFSNQPPCSRPAMGPPCLHGGTQSPHFVILPVEAVQASMPALAASFTSLAAMDDGVRVPFQCWLHLGAHSTRCDFYSSIPPSHHYLDQDTIINFFLSLTYLARSRPSVRVSSASLALFLTKSAPGPSPPPASDVLSPSLTRLHTTVSTGSKQSVSPLPSVLHLSSPSHKSPERPARADSCAQLVRPESAERRAQPAELHSIRAIPLFTLTPGPGAKPARQPQRTGARISTTLRRPSIKIICRLATFEVRSADWLLPALTT